MFGLKSKKYSALTKKSDLIKLSMCIPVLLKLLIFSYIPMIGILLAFKEFYPDLGLFGSPWVGWANFELFFESGQAWEVIFNTISMNLIFIFSGLVVSVALGVFMAEIKNRILLKGFQTLMFLPYFISWVVAGMLWGAYLKDTGMINQILGAMGIEKIAFYFEDKYWYFILPIAHIWKASGVGAIIYYANIIGIDREYYEAAMLDGCGTGKRILYITLPLIKTMMIVLTIINLGNIMKSDFGIFFFLTKDSPELRGVTEVLSTYTFRMVRLQPNFELAAAVGLFESLVGAMLVLTANTISRKINKHASLF